MNGIKFNKGQTPQDVCMKIFELKNVHNMTGRQIAKELNMSYHNVDSVLYRNKRFKNGNYSKFRIGETS